MNLNCSLICTVLRTLNCTNWNIIRFTGQDIGLKDCWRSTIGKLSAYFRVTGQVRSNTIISKFITRTLKQIKQSVLSEFIFFLRNAVKFRKLRQPMAKQKFNFDLFWFLSNYQPLLSKILIETNSKIILYNQKSRANLKISTYIKFSSREELSANQ